MDWIDISRGIGIFLVIIGHANNYIPTFLRTWIYTFHMPLFFMLSGFLHRENISLTELIEKRIKSLLVPYAVCSVSYAFINFVIYDGDLNRLGNQLSELFLGRAPSGGTVLWFFIALFWVEIFFHLVFRLSYGPILILLLTTIGYIFSSLPFRLHEPHFYIPSALIVLGFYYGGFLLKKRNWMKGYGGIAFVISLLLNIVLTITAILIFSEKGVVDIKNNVICDFLIVYLMAYSGSSCVIYISKSLSDHGVTPIKGLSGLLSLLAKGLKYIGGRYSRYFFTITYYVPWLIEKKLSQMGYGLSVTIRIASVAVSFLLTIFLIETSIYLQGKLQGKLTKTY